MARHHCTCPATLATLATLTTTNGPALSISLEFPRGAEHSQPRLLQVRIIVFQRLMAGPLTPFGPATFRSKCSTTFSWCQSLRPAVADSDSADGLARTGPTAMTSSRPLDHAYNSYTSPPTPAHPRRCQSNFNPCICIYPARHNRGTSSPPPLQTHHLNVNVMNAPSDPILNDAEPRSGTGPGPEGAALDSFLRTLFRAQFATSQSIACDPHPGAFFSVERPQTPSAPKSSCAVCRSSQQAWCGAWSASRRCWALWPI